MFIEKLELKNFRSHTPKTAFEFDRINVIRGHHGVGKSSIALAIEFLLTGACAVTDAAGRGAEALTSFGHEEFGVRGSIALGEASTASTRSMPGAVITRTRGAKGGNLLVVANKKNITSKAADAWTEEHLGPRPVLSAVLNSQRFLTMADKDRKQLLTMALAADPVKLNDEIIDLLKACEEAHDLCEGYEISDPNHAEQIYKKLYDWRRGINTALREMGEAAEPERPAGMPSLKDAQLKLDKLHSERTDLERAKARELAEHSAKKQRLEQARADLKEYEPQILTAEEMKRLDGIARHKTAAADLDQQIQVERFAISQGQQQLESLQEAQKAGGGTCDACGQPLPKKDLTDTINRAAHNIEIAEKELAELEQKRAALGDPLDAEQKLTAHKRAVPKVGQAEHAIDEVGKVPDSVDVSGYDTKIAELSARITKGAEVLGQINQFEGQLRQFQQQKLQRETLEQKQVKAERLVDYFGPNGELRPLLVGDKLGQFAEKLNAVLARFGFRCELSLEPFSIGVGYYVSGPGSAVDKFRTIDQLSESEAYRFGVSFQIALAEATGVRMAVFDRADLLLPSTRRFLTSALMESHLDQAFVLAAQEDFALKSAPPAGVRIIDLAKNDQGQTIIGAVHKQENKELEYAQE